MTKSQKLDDAYLCLVDIFTKNLKFNEKFTNLNEAASLFQKVLDIEESKNKDDLNFSATIGLIFCRMMLATPNLKIILTEFDNHLSVYSNLNEKVTLPKNKELNSRLIQHLHAKVHEIKNNTLSQCEYLQNRIECICMQLNLNHDNRPLLSILNLPTDIEILRLNAISDLTDLEGRKIDIANLQKLKNMIDLETYKTIDRDLADKLCNIASRPREIDETILGYEALKQAYNSEIEKYKDREDERLLIGVYSANRDTYDIYLKWHFQVLQIIKTIYELKTTHSQLDYDILKEQRNFDDAALEINRYIDHTNLDVKVSDHQSDEKVRSYIQQISEWRCEFSEETKTKKILIALEKFDVDHGITSTWNTAKELEQTMSDVSLPITKPSGSFISASEIVNFSKSFKRHRNEHDQVQAQSREKDQDKLVNDRKRPKHEVKTKSADIKIAKTDKIDIKMKNTETGGYENEFLNFSIRYWGDYNASNISEKVIIDFCEQSKSYTNRDDLRPDNAVLRYLYTSVGRAKVKLRNYQTRTILAVLPQILKYHISLLPQFNSAADKSIAIQGIIECYVELKNDSIAKLQQNIIFEDLLTVFDFAKNNSDSMNAFALMSLMDIITQDLRKKDCNNTLSARLTQEHFDAIWNRIYQVTDYKTGFMCYVVSFASAIIRAKHFNSNLLYNVNREQIKYASKFFNTLADNKNLRIDRIKDMYFLFDLYTDADDGLFDSEYVIDVLRKSSNSLKECIAAKSLDKNIVFLNEALKNYLNLIRNRSNTTLGMSVTSEQLAAIIEAAADNPDIDASTIIDSLSSLANHNESNYRIQDISSKAFSKLFNRAVKKHSDEISLVVILKALNRIVCNDNNDIVKRIDPAAFQTLLSKILLSKYTMKDDPFNKIMLCIDNLMRIKSGHSLFSNLDSSYLNELFKKYIYDKTYPLTLACIEQLFHHIAKLSKSDLSRSWISQFENHLLPTLIKKMIENKTVNTTTAWSFNVLVGCLAANKSTAHLLKEIPSSLLVTMMTNCDEKYIINAFSTLKTLLLEGNSNHLLTNLDNNFLFNLYFKHADYIQNQIKFGFILEGFIANIERLGTPIKIENSTIHLVKPKLESFIARIFLSIEIRLEKKIKNRYDDFMAHSLNIGISTIKLMNQGVVDYNEKWLTIILHDILFKLNQSIRTNSLETIANILQQFSLLFAKNSKLLPIFNKLLIEVFHKTVATIEEVVPRIFKSELLTKIKWLEVLKPIASEKEDKIDHSNKKENEIVKEKKGNENEKEAVNEKISKEKILAEKIVHEDATLAAIKAPSIQSKTNIIEIKSDKTFKHIYHTNNPDSIQQLVKDSGNTFVYNIDFNDKYLKRRKLDLSIIEIALLNGEKGLITNKEIKPGQLFEYYGDLDVIVEDDKLASQDDDSFVFELTDANGEISEILDALKNRDCSAYVNHSPTPNCYVTQIEKIVDGKIVRGLLFKALHIIKPGEQITFDYQPFYWQAKKIKPFNMHPTDNNLTDAEVFLNKKCHYSMEAVNLDARTTRDLKLEYRDENYNLCGRAIVMPKIMHAIFANNSEALHVILTNPPLEQNEEETRESYQKGGKQKEVDYKQDKKSKLTKQQMQQNARKQVNLYAYSLNKATFNKLADPIHQEHITPLMLACYLGKNKCIELLLDYGADVNRVMLTAGYSAFTMLAKGYANQEDFEKYGFEIIDNMQFPFVLDCESNTSLHYALRRKSDKLLNTIVKRAINDEFALFKFIIDNQKFNRQVNDFDSCLLSGNFAIFELFLKNIIEHPVLMDGQFLQYIKDNKVFKLETLSEMPLDDLLKLQMILNKAEYKNVLSDSLLMERIQKCIHEIKKQRQSLGDNSHNTSQYNNTIVQFQPNKIYNTKLNTNALEQKIPFKHASHISEFNG